MEAEYGRFYLSNYQDQPWLRCRAPEEPPALARPAAAVSQPKVERPAASPAASPAAASPPLLAAAPPLPLASPPAPERPVPAAASPPGRAGGQPSLFRLAPPPATAAICSVGSQSPEAKVAVIESLIEEKPVGQASSVADNFLGPVVPQDDDEELLLGDEAVAPGTGGPVLHKRNLADGVDSASESEADVGGSARSRPSAAPPSSAASPSRGPEPPPRARPAAPPGTPVKVPALAMPNLGAAAFQQAPVAAETGGSGSPLPAPRAPQGSQAFTTPRASPGPAARAPAPPSTPADALPSPDWGRQFGTMKEIDSQVNMSLDRFFSDDRLWERVAKEVSSSSAKLRSSMDTQHIARYFRVQVPKPYPGVQYRKSKCLDDRYPRYAKHGSVVMGQVEDKGEWLRISGNVFLPMKVGTIAILEPLPREAGREATGSPEDEQSARWWACGPGGSNAEQVVGSKETAEVVVNQDGYLNIPEGLNQNLPWEEASATAANRSAAGPPPGAPESAAAALAERLTAARRETGQEPLSPEARAAGAAAAARSLLPEPLPGSRLANLDAASRILADPINPFSDTPRGGSPADSPLRSRPVSVHA